MLSALLSLLAATNLAAGHFLLNYPPTIGFDDDLEGDSPCGSFTPSFNGTVTNVTIGGFPVELRSIHPEADWLFRATTDQSAPFNWTNLLPVVSEIGLGDFCIPSMMAPSDFEGKTGIIQVMQDAVDGILYQCSVVSFVAGMNMTVGSGCNNVTGLTANLTSKSSFGAASATASSTISMSSGASMTTSMSSASASSTGSSSSFAPLSAAPRLIIAALAGVGGIIYLLFL